MRYVVVTSFANYFAVLPGPLKVLGYAIGGSQELAYMEIKALWPTDLGEVLAGCKRCVYRYCLAGVRCYHWRP